MRRRARSRLIAFSLTLAGPILFSGGTSWPSEPTLLDRLLEIEKEHRQLCQEVSVTDLRGQLAALTENLRAQSKLLAQSPDRGRQVVASLNDVIFGQLGIQPSQDLHDPCNLLLSSVLARKQGYCVGIAALYLGLGESAGLPLFAVATPSHVFLRYDDGATRINIETFQRGAAVADEQYLREQKIPEISIRKGVFMRNLSADEFLAQVYNNLGVIYSEKEDFARAAQEFQRACYLAPRFPAPLYNYGNNFLRHGDAKSAVKLFTRSLHLYPTDVWALNNRGLAYMKLGKAEKARRDFEAALQMDPTFEAAKQNLGRMAAASR